MQMNTRRKNFPFVLEIRLPVLSLSENALWTLYTIEILSIYELFLEHCCKQPNNAVHLQSLFVPY